MSTMIGRITALFAGLLLSVMSQGVLADVTATYQLNDGNSMTVSYRDDSHIRLDVEKNTFLLVSGGKTWMVTREGKTWQAMDMAAMGKMMQSMKGMNIPGMNQAQSAQTTDTDSVTMKKTGRTETVAGYKGDVYQVTDKAAGTVQEVVLTDHADVVAVSKAWIALSGNMMSQMGMADITADLQQALAQGQAKGMAGFLRQGQDMKLTALSKKAQPDSYFSLPAGTKIQDMPAMPNMDFGAMQQQMQQQMEQAQQSPASGTSTEEQALKQEAINEGKRQVQEGMKKMLKGLF